MNNNANSSILYQQKGVLLYKFEYSSCLARHEVDKQSGLYRHRREATLMWGGAEDGFEIIMSATGATLK